MVQALTGIDGAEGEAKQSIIVGVLLELSANRFRKLNSLANYHDTANVNSIGVDIATGAALVAIADLPCRPRKLLGTFRLAWVVKLMALTLRCR